MGTEIDLSALGETLKVNEGYNLKNSDFIADMVNQKFKFVSVIESLRDVLTNQDVAVRERGIDFLSWILTEIPPDLFSGQEISVVVNFYSDRLKDHHNIAPATIRGLLALVKMKNIQKESIRQFLVPLFQEMNCQTQRQSDRYNIFSIVGYIVENHLGTVAAMGSDFVFGIISLADGETDPSNLLLLFQFLPLFLKNVELGHLMEEMFGLLACYFPIDYSNAAKNIPITRENLADGLMNCLSARPDFSDYCLPLIFEKLDSTLKQARIDSYKLLGACCKTYTIESINSKASDIWKYIQKDVMPAVDQQICEAALYTLSEIVRLFTSERQILKKFVDDILISIRTLLNNVEDNLFQSAIAVLLAVSSKSLEAAEYVLSNLRLVFSAEKVKSSAQRKIAISALKPFLGIVKKYKIAQSENVENRSFFNEIAQFYLDSSKTNDDEIRKVALLGLQELVSEFDGNLRKQMLEIVEYQIKTEENDMIRKESLKILRQVARQTPEEVLHFLKSLEQSVESSSDLKSFASAVSVVADANGIMHYAVPQLISIVTNSDNFDVGLLSLLDSCRMVVDDSRQFLKALHEEYNLMERLMDWWTEGLSAQRTWDTSTVQNLSEVIALIMRRQETCVQQSVLNRFVPSFLNLIDSGPERNVILTEAMVGSVRPDVRLDKFSSLAMRLVTLSLSSEDEWVRTSSSRLLASMLNKRADDSLFELVCEEVFKALDKTSLITERLNGARLLTWIVKALLLANANNLESVLYKWFDLLDREDVGEVVVDGVQIVLQQENLFLNMDSHCNIKILYRQRLFTAFPKLIEKFERCNEAVKPNYLLALMRLIEGVPRHVAATDTAKVLVTMMQALDLQRQDVVALSLSMLDEWLQEKETILESHALSLIPKFLAISRFGTCMKIRINALKCLHSYAFYPTFIILPVKNEVIKSLEQCLDDKKRLVRTEAVRARSRWFLVGAPGEDSVFS